MNLFCIREEIQIVFRKIQTTDISDQIESQSIEIIEQITDQITSQTTELTSQIDRSINSSVAVGSGSTHGFQGRIGFQGRVGRKSRTHGLNRVEKFNPDQ